MKNLVLIAVIFGVFISNTIVLGDEPTPPPPPPIPAAAPPYPFPPPNPADHGGIDPLILMMMMKRGRNDRRDYRGRRKATDYYGVSRKALKARLENAKLTEIEKGGMDKAFLKNTDILKRYLQRMKSGSDDGDSAEMRASVAYLLDYVLYDHRGLQIFNLDLELQSIRNTREMFRILALGQRSPIFFPTMRASNLSVDKELWVRGIATDQKRRRLERLQMRSPIPRVIGDPKKEAKKIDAALNAD